MRVRGLKQTIEDYNSTGAMSHPVRVRGLKPPITELKSQLKLSHPVRVRGLKPLNLPLLDRFLSVAPRAGAWIETGLLPRTHRRSRSHPVRVRGLKPHDEQMKILGRMSHPVRVRGLKL